ncbi:hypothetical protein [Paraburkholderia diazotrophica]|uniref:hypothetical protein n=1 Tax=Paraburkholderia diazotrophica TaxID=667676 RepID=UPI003D164205
MTAPRRPRLRIAILGRQLALRGRRRLCLAAGKTETLRIRAIASSLCTPFDILRRETVLDHQFADLVQRALSALGDDRFGLGLQLLYTCLDRFQCRHYCLPLNYKADYATELLRSAMVLKRE